MASCKYEGKRKDARMFLQVQEDGDLLRRRALHESEQKKWGRERPVGSLSRGKRLIWMRETRYLIAERRLDA